MDLKIILVIGGVAVLIILLLVIIFLLRKPQMIPMETIPAEPFYTTSPQAAPDAPSPKAF